MATPPHTPSPGATPVGNAVALPPEYQALNTPQNPHAGILKYADDFYQKTGKLPPRFKVENGHAVEWEPGFLSRHPWLYPVIGIAMGLTGGAITGTLGGGGGTTTVGSTGAWDAAGNFIGDSTVTGAGVTEPIAAAGGNGAWDEAGNFIGDTTYSSSNGARGNLGSYLSTADDIANAFGGLSAGRQQGRNAENFNNYNFDRAQQDQYRTQIQANANENDFGLGRARLGLDTSTQANNFALNRVGAGINLSDADLRQQQFSLDAPKARARNSVQGDILANAQDVSLSGLPSTIPNISIQGGLRPSMFSPNTRALGGEMSAQALASQRAGDHFKPLPDLPSYQAPSTGLPDYVQPPKAPGVTPPVQATGLDSFLNTSGGLLSLAGLFAKYWPK